MWIILFLFVFYGVLFWKKERIKSSSINFIKQLIHPVQIDNFTLGFQKSEKGTTQFAVVLNNISISLSSASLFLDKLDINANRVHNPFEFILPMTIHLMKCVISWIIPPGFIIALVETILDIPVQLLMNVLAKYIVIQVNNLLIRIENNNHSAFLFRIDYIIIDTERQQQTVYSTTRSQVNRSIFQEKHKLTINMRVGPIYIGTESNERSVGVITPSHVLAFYYFQPRRFCLQDLDLKTTIGEIVVDGYNCYSMVELIQKLRRGSASSSIVKKGRVKWENVINSNSLSISYINIVYSHQNPMVKGSIEISGINSIIHTRERLDSDQHPLGQLSANKIKCVLKQQQDDTTIAAFSLPNLEIKATYVLNSLFFTSGEPRSDFLFATIQLDSPLVTTNVVRLSQIMTELDSSSSNQPVEYKEEKQKMGPFKLSLVDIPACGLAFVLNKPRVEFTDIPPNKVPEKCLSGVLSANNLIVRLSGEYIAKSNRAGIADIPSSFSSSSLSSLDSFFVKQEYRWLNTSLGGSSSDLLQTNRNSMEFNRRGRDHILKRMSHRQGSLDFSRSHEDTRQWSYRWVGKIIFQKLDIGHHCQDGHSPLVYIKHAAIVLRSRMEIALDQDKQSIESTWSPGNGIQAEAAVEKPIIYIYNAQDSISSLVFWMSILPQFFARKQETTNEKREVSAVIKRIMRNVGFSLDVSRGSIIAVNADRKKTNKSSPPGGYVDNTPVVDVVSRIVFYTHKFTFVWESPESREETWREDASLNGIWRSRCFMEKLSLQQSSWSESNLSTPDNRDKNQHESYPIIWISQLNLSAKFTSNHKEGEVLPSVGVDIVFKVKKKGIQYSVRNHYACLLLVDSMKDLKRQLFLDQKPEELKLKGVPQKPSILFIQCISFQMERVDVRVMLPNNTPLYARVDGLFVQVEPAGEQPIISLRNMMLLGISPTRAHHWDQLIEVDKFTIDIRKTTDINLRAKKVFARIPYNYILADVIDNVIGLVKAIKDLHLRLGASEPAYTFFGPIPKNDPIMIPIICIRTDVFTLHFDDDPFEVKLRRILSTGKLEQERRLAYREAMDHKISELYEEINSVSPINSDSSLPSQVLSMSKVNELEDRIEQAENGLLKHYSESWLRHINKTIQEESHFYHQMHITENYRNPLIVGELDMSLDDDDEGNSGEFLLSNAFSIKILPLPLNPPLANFSSQLAKVKFRPADFPLTETRQFIHEVGRGVPLNTSFSIIIPFHLSIISGETWVKLRDYPLPLLYVPKNMETSSGHTTSTRKISWTLDGNYVLADDLGDSSGSRFIPIEIIPVSEYSPGYIIAAVRTASPLKFYSIIEYNVIPKAMSSICWSPSYNPVIQDIIHILDRLTPAQVDPSPRIGFWDKVRMMIHTRTTIHFSGNGDLAVVVKGTRNPYKLNENGKGLAKIWSNDVVCLLGYENPQKEILQVISVNYAFGVPDLIRGGYVPNIPDALPYTLEKIESNSESKFSKIALKLSDGIRMGIGLDFERLCCPSDTCSECEKLLQPVHLIDRCRSLTFSPHYDILFRSKSYVESEYKEKAEDYDAFKEFRSHFVHLAFSIVKLQKNKDRPQDNKLSGNSMYLSPCFVEHFMNWFRMFGSPLSLPVREGKLFPSGESSPPKKFGEHLNTIKYKICVNPLAIGYFCTEDEAIPDTGGSAGLKAIVSSFSVDLHQRREIVKTKFNDMEPVKTEMNFHEIELQLQEIDLRAVRAEYTQKTQPVKTNYHVNPNEEYQSDVYSLHNETSQTNYWIDSSDFVMLSIKSMFENPNTKINIHPFIFSPLFHYIRQSDEHGTEKRRYLRDTHECIMGRGFDTHESQKLFLEQRASLLDDNIEKYDKELDDILFKLNFRRNDSNLNELYESVRKQLEFLRGRRVMLHNYMAEMILESELSITDHHHQINGSPHSVASSTGRYMLSRWETLMGHFKNKCAIHNPQIIWNTSVRDIVYYWEHVRSNYRIRKYNLSTRCIMFLHNLVEKSQANKQWQPMGPEVDDEYQYETSADKNMTHELINKLLEERQTHFVAYNEKEEQKNEEIKRYNGVYVLEEDLDNVNDPDYQYKNIPQGYEMKSNFLFDMVNPQVNFQSDRGSGHLILLANERTQIKTFDIVDCENSVDTDVDLVKVRTIVNLEKAQVLVAKRVQHDSIYLHSHNGYGLETKQKIHWATWTQPEQLWFFREARFFDNFQCIASQLSGNVQLDRHNPLRIKSNSTIQSRTNPFEDRSNTTHLHFPQVTLSLTSLEAHILYYSLTNLLFGSERNPKKKERTEKLQDLMLAAERSDLAETVKQVGELQKRARTLLDFHRKFKQKELVLDAHGLQEFKLNREKLYENIEKLDLIVEAIKSIQTFRRDIHMRETDTARKFIFNANVISWEALLDDQSSLCKWTLSNTRFSVLQKANESSRKTIEIDQIHIKNTTESPVFIDVLDAYLDSKKNNRPNFSKHKMLYGLLDSLPPVGGIPVIQHCEVNLAPIHLQLSTAFGTAMKDYFFPESKDKELVENIKDDSSLLFFQYGLQEEDPEDDKVSTTSKKSSSIFSFDMLSKKVRLPAKEKSVIKADELSVMKSRSSTNRTFILVKISGAKHCLSLQGPKESTFYNLYNFSFKQPSLEYRNRTWSTAEMLEEIQKQMFIAIIKHSPALLKKKLLRNKRTRAGSTSSLASSSSDLGNDSVLYNYVDSIKSKDQASSSKSFSRLNMYDTTDDDDESGDFYSKSLNSNDPGDDYRSVESLKSDKKSIHSSNSNKKKNKVVTQMDDLIAKGKLLLGKTYNGSTNIQHFNNK